MGCKKRKLVTRYGARGQTSRQADTDHLARRWTDHASESSMKLSCWTRPAMSRVEGQSLDETQRRTDNGKVSLDQSGDNSPSGSSWSCMRTGETVCAVDGNGRRKGRNMDLKVRRGWHAPRRTFAYESMMTKSTVITSSGHVTKADAALLWERATSSRFVDRSLVEERSPAAVKGIGCSARQ